MKRIILVVILITTIIIIGCKTEKKEEKNKTTAAITNTSFGVRGNCSMCKKTIEKVANSVDGVTAANWDKAKKKIDISFNTTKTSSADIEKAIAVSGYDTENVMGDLDAYKGLSACCKYDHEMKMNQSGDKKDKNTH